MEFDLDPDRLELTMRSQHALGTVPLFNGIDDDFVGRTTGAKRPPGPFGDPGGATVRTVDPRAARSVTRPASGIEN